MVRMELPQSQVITSTSPRSWFSVMVARAVGPLRPSSAESLQVLQSALRPLVVLLPPLLVQVPLCLLLLPLILLVEISLLEVVLGQISSRETWPWRHQRLVTGYLGELKSRLLTWRRRGADAEAWIRADTVYCVDSVDIKFIWVRVTCCPDNNDMSNLAMSETIRCVLVVSKPLLQMFQSLHLHHVPCLQLR